MKSLEDIENSVTNSYNSDGHLQMLSKHIYKKEDYEKCILTEIREIKFKWDGIEHSVKNTLTINIINGKLLIDNTEFSGIELVDRAFKFSHWFRTQLFFFNSFPYRIALIMMIIIFYLM